jgi:maltose-binding protein MalE
MKAHKLSSWLPLAALIAICLIASDCDGEATVEVDCHGDVYVENDTVAQVTPSPRQVYTDGQTYAWTAPPYGVEVTGANGEADMQIYSAADILLAKYTIYAADIVNGDVTVKEWDGLSEITFNAGNFIVEDNDSQEICNLDLFAGGVGITSTGTKYVITVRPAINEVKVAILEGSLLLTSQGQTVTLDASVPSQALAVISYGAFAPLQPIPDPNNLLRDIGTGLDIVIEPPESLTIWADDRLVSILQEFGAQFENDTGVAVQIEGMPIFDINARYASAVQTGELPDLVTLPHADSFQLIADGSFLPVETGISPDLLMPGASQAFTYKGVTYGVPYVYDNLALVSNPEYVSGIPPTWFELRYYAEEIAAGRENFTSLMIPAYGYYFYPVQSAFGGYIFGTFPDGSYDPQNLGMSSDGSLAAAQWFRDLVSFTPYFLGDEDQALQYFGERQAAMIVAGSWSLPRLREMGVPFQINRFPGEVQESQPFLSVYGFLISTNSQAQRSAQNFVSNYLTTYQAIYAYAMTLGAAPARRDVLENLEDADLQAFGIAGEYGIPILNLPEMGAVWNPWTDAIRAIIEGTLSPQDAFIIATDQIYKNMYP